MTLIAIVHNTKLDRFHPVVLLERPLPGPLGQSAPLRFESAAHHTAGFATREEAMVHVGAELMSRFDPSELLDEIGEWDGEDKPVMVVLRDPSMGH